MRTNVVMGMVPILIGVSVLADSKNAKNPLIVVRHYEPDEVSMGALADMLLPLHGKKGPVVGLPKPSGEDKEKRKRRG